MWKKLIGSLAALCITSGGLLMFVGSLDDDSKTVSEMMIPSVVSKVSTKKQLVTGDYETVIYIRSENDRGFSFEMESNCRVESSLVGTHVVYVKQITKKGNIRYKLRDLAAFEREVLEKHCWQN